jgi:ABC-type nitrate/sulfonate/bicarbonate transport system substrate-binding protein
MMTIDRALDRRRLIRAGAATLALVASPRALGLPAMAAAPMPEKIVIGTLPFNTEITAYIGDIDYFREEGLSVELFHGQSEPAVVQALVDGSIPLGEIGLGAAITATGRGLPLVHPALGAIGAPKHPLSRIMVREDSPVKDVAALKGKKLALAQRGSIEELGLAALKKTHGIGVEDLEIMGVSAPNQSHALEQGSVDAIYALPPADAVAERRFHARTLIKPRISSRISATLRSPCGAISSMPFPMPRGRRRRPGPSSAAGSMTTPTPRTSPSAPISASTTISVPISVSPISPATACR